jgi:hypothetical protein
MIYFSKIACIMGTLLLGDSLAQTPRGPPKGGKFFYMDYAKEPISGFYIAKTLLGTENLPFDMIMSASGY